MPVVTSAGALVAGLAALGARRVALIAPYVPPLTAKVCDYLAAYGVEVVDADQPRRRRQRGGRAGSTRRGWPSWPPGWTCTDADAVVLSACVQMPSLPAVPLVEKAAGAPVLTAATATVHQVLTRLGRSTRIPGAGALLA